MAYREFDGTLDGDDKKQDGASYRPFDGTLDAAPESGGVMGMLGAVSDAIKSVPIIPPTESPNGVMDRVQGNLPLEVPAELGPMVSPDRWAQVRAAEQAEPLDPRLVDVAPHDLQAKAEQLAARQARAGNARFQRVLADARAQRVRDAAEAARPTFLDNVGAAAKDAAAMVGMNVLGAQRRLIDPAYNDQAAAEDFKTGRNVSAGVLKIGPTAAKGIADIGRLVSGDTVGKDTSQLLDAGMKAIDQVIASPEFNANQQSFHALMSNPNAGVGDMYAYLVDHPSILLDNGITTVGSMFLPMGAASGTIGAARMLGASEKAIGAAATAASMGTVAAQNAADTFTSDSLQNAELGDRYRAASVSAAISLLAGIATHGGAEGEIARRMAGDLQAGKTTLEAVKGYLKAFGNEAAQEMGEEFGNAAGEAVGTLTPMDRNNTMKRMAFAGTVGGLFGAATHATGGHAQEDDGSAAAEAARQAALQKWRTEGLSARPATAGRTEPTWSDATAPAAPGRPEPTIDDITSATTVDDAIAAAQAIVSKPLASPHATAADVDALEQQAGMLGSAPASGVDLTAGIDPDTLDQVRAPQSAPQNIPENIPAAPAADGNWYPFPADTGTLGIPRAEMPQIKAEHRGAMTQFLNARGITHEHVEVPAHSLKPTQAEFSLDKVQQAHDYQGGNRSILISSDGHVLDGHHQWLADADTGAQTKAIRLNAPIRQLLDAVREFPSATVDTASEPDTAAPAWDHSAQVRQQRLDQQLQQAAANAEAAKKQGGGQRARERLKAGNPFLAFLASHGIALDDRADTGAEKGRAGNPMVPGYGPVYRRTGKRLDELALLAREAGFLTQNDIDNPGDTGGTRKLSDLIARAVHSREVIRQAGMLEQHEPSADARLMDEAQSLGIDTAGKTPEQVYDEVVAAHGALEARRETVGTASVDEQELVDHYADQFTPQEEALAAQLDDIQLEGGRPMNDLTDEEIDAIFGITAQADGRQAETGTEGTAPQGAGRAQGTRQGEPTPDLLTPYSREDVVARQEAEETSARAREDERKRLEAQRRKEQDDKETRARMEASAEHFQLGQSAEDALAGQNDLFAPQSETKPAQSVTEPAKSETPLQREIARLRQPRVHTYDPDNARPLLLIACSDAKLEGRHRAGDLYQGVMFDVLRKWMPTRNPPDVYVISAKHGLVHWTTELDTYEQPMTAERQQELIAKGIDVREFGDKNFSEVYIAGGKLYRGLGEAYAKYLQMAGFAAPKATVHGTEGGIGEQRGQLGEYLRQLEQNAPEGSAERAAKIDADYQRYKDGFERARLFSEQESQKRADEKAAKLANATAPEHVQTGVDDRELGEIVAEFNEAQAEMMEGEHPVSNVFQPPKPSEIVRLEKKAGITSKNQGGKKVYHRDAGWMTLEEAKAHVQKWKDHAAAQYDDYAARSANSRRIVLSLFDLSGEWSKPWEEAGYQVYRFDIQNEDTYEDPETGEEKKIGDVNNMSVEFFNDLFGDFDGNDVYAVLAATPCTDFAVSGARHFAAKDADGRTVASVKLVHQTLRLIEYYKPAVWAVENPVGRIEELGGLPPWRLSFDPYQLGDPYTKKTLIWGRFNADLPVAPVEPTEGSKMHKLYGGKSMATKNARSETPEGFSYGFFMANNAIDHPILAIANKYDRLDRKLIQRAVDAGITEAQISDAVDDFYFMDLDDDAANDAIRALIEDGPEPTEADPADALPNQLPDLEGQLDQVLAEEVAAKPEGSDLDAMFDAILAEEMDRLQRKTANKVKAKGKAEPAEPAATGEKAKLEGKRAKASPASVKKYQDHVAEVVAAGVDGMTGADVGDVIDEAKPAMRPGLASYLLQARPDLNDDVLGTMEEWSYALEGEKFVKVDHKPRGGSFTLGQGKFPSQAGAAVLVKETKKYGSSAIETDYTIKLDGRPAGQFHLNGLTGAVSEVRINEGFDNADVREAIDYFANAHTKAYPHRYIDGEFVDGKGAARKAAPAGSKKPFDPAAFIKKYAKSAADVNAPDVRRLLDEAGAQAPAVASLLGEQGHLVMTVAEEMERLGFQHTGWDGIKPTFDKPVTKAEADRAEAERNRSAGQAAASAAKHTAAGFAAAVQGLGELFGATIDPKTKAVEWDESKYQKAAVLFDAAVANFGQAVTDVADVMRAVIRDVLASFGPEITANMRPYVLRYTQDYQDGKRKGESNADGSSANSERDSADGADGQPGTEPSVFDVRPAAGRQARPADGAADEAGDGQVDRARVPGRDAATGGAQGNQRVPGRQQPGRSAGRAAEPRDTRGSRDSGHEESQSQSRAVGEPATSTGARLSLDEKRAAQRAAERIEVVPGDLANIRATLPFLLDGQIDDVHFAETRFANSDKQPGVMFTNGTGTGKTYTGLGIAKRFERMGKGNGIIVVPNNQIAQDWIKSGEDLGLTIRMLDSLQDNGGRGIVVTTYANFGANTTLADREWDWVMPDEAHYLMASKDAKDTDALRTLRALTRHPEGFHAYSRMKNRDLYALLEQTDNKESARAKHLYAQIKAREDEQKPAFAAVANSSAKRPKTVFLSATPFAYDKAIDYAEGYLFQYPADGRIGNSNQDGRAHFFVQHFGYRIRYHKLTEPDANVDRGLMARQFNSWLKAEGALSGRMLDVEADYSRRFIMVKSALGSKIDEGLAFVYEGDDGKFMPLHKPLMKQFDYLSRRFLLEAIKAKESLPIIREHLALGRKVGIVHDYKKGGAFNPFTNLRLDAGTVYVSGYKHGTDPDEYGSRVDLGELYDELRARRPDLMELDIPRQSALDILTGAFPDALVHNGDVPGKQLEANKRLFNDDDSKHRIIILQSDKGREGISLHDTTGKFQRVGINIGMPGKPTALIQLEGRFYRTGQVTDAVLDYLNTGTSWERYTFAQTIAERADIAEALAMGDNARALKESIIEAFENSGDHAITAEDGKGGKARDREKAKLLTDWDRAKSFYYGQLKRNSSSKAQEGKDYFATPEPLGLKMVEWADIRPGEDVLEPSGGHGAIARWFPIQAGKTIVEPSTELITRARLVVEGSAKFVQSRFEDLNIVNKYDAIVMNPPFGLGGSDAIPHLAKAYKHLRDGGRIVALLPRGTAADKRLEKFLHGDDAPKDLYQVADIQLPASTFSRAGTGVMTHIVVLDRISDPAKAPQQVSRDYVSAESVEELFDRLEQSTLPGRVKTETAEDVAIEEAKKPAKAKRAAAEGATGAERFYAQFEFDHTKTNERMYGAAMLNRVSMDAYKQANAIAKRHGGWYNKFTGGGAQRGFLFRSSDERAAFMAEAGQLGEVSAGLEAQNSRAVDGIESRLAEHMAGIADDRGMVHARELLAWVEQQPHANAIPLANWLRVMGDAEVSQSSVSKFMAGSGNAMFSQMPVFYSALARALPDMAKIAAKDGTVKPEQARLWLQARQKEGKFKADELQWSGLDDWLKLQTGRVTVDDIALFVEENGVQVEEVEKGQQEEISQKLDFEEAQQAVEAGEYVVNQWGGRVNPDRAHLMASGETYYRITGGKASPTKYHPYQLPGGENYRELLLTLPTAKADGYKGVIHFDNDDDVDDFLVDVSAEGMENLDYGRIDGGTSVEFSAMAPADAARFRELAERMGGTVEAAHDTAAAYQSKHWDEKNVIAHVRFNDRVDADGKRVLFIEELQSDWGQEGLKHGFKPTAAEEAAVKAEYDAADNALRATPEGAPGRKEAEARYEAAMDAYNRRINDAGTPQAPFVTDTKSWLSLGIKRMVRYAAENGYDRVAFVNGQQSAERYDLSKQISRIEFDDNSSGGIGRPDMKGPVERGTLRAYDHNGRTVIDQFIHSPKELEDAIGKEAAKKLLEQKPTEARSAGIGVRRHMLEGVDLKVGGEGMKAFYDKIVPQTVNDVLKKLGGGKTGTITIAGPGGESAYRVVGNGGFVFGTYRSREEAEAMVPVIRANFGNQSPKVEVNNETRLEQPGFDITPELRAKALDGLPLFSKAFSPARRQLLAAAAAAAVAPGAKAGAKLGKAVAIDPRVLAQRVAPSVEKILRDGRTDGSSSPAGMKLLRQAMKAIALTGPKELRALAGQIEKLLPAQGTMILTVDDHRRMNVHGAVSFEPVLHLQLFTAEGRTGLTYETILHEALHVAVAARYRSLSTGMARENDKLLGLSAPQAARALEQFDQVWNEFRSATAGEKFGNRDLELAIMEARGNPDEFFVRALTDPALQAYMAGKRYEGKTLWQRFKDWVKTHLFGLVEAGGTAPSWLDAALLASTELAEAMGGDRADFSRMGAISRYQTADRGGDGDGGPADQGMMAQRRAPAPTWSDPDMTRMDNIIHTLQDKHIDMKRVVQAIRAQSGELEDKWNPYLQEELFHGRAATGFKEFLHAELRPLLTDMQARGVSMENLEQYLHMRHAEEANEQIASINPELPDGGSGVTTQEARDYLDALTPDEQRAFEALAKRVDAMIGGTQQLLVDYGLEKQSTIDTWNATYEHYVPLHREDMEFGKRGNGTGQGFSVRGPASKRRTGSERNVVNILANVALARERAIVRGEKNRLDVALYGLALQAPNPEFWRPVNPQKNPDALRHELDEMGLSPALITTIMDEPRHKVIDKQTGLVVRRANPLLRNAPNVVAVRVGGEDRFIFFNERNERAMRMALTLKNMDNGGLNRFLNAAGWVTRKFAAINTQYNPIFGIVNLVRDTGEAAVNLSATQLAGKQLELMHESSRLLAKIVAHGFHLDRLQGADAALWAEFQREGGITGYRTMFNTSDERADELRRELGRITEGAGAHSLRVVGELLSDYNEALENVTRMAAYKVAKDNGMSNQQAASLAKNLTVNFNRRGAVGAQVGALYAFFNAATQGIARMAQTLNSPAGTKIIAGGLLVGVLQAFMMAAAGFDDEEPPEFVRAKNFIIPLKLATGKKNYVSIPLPLGFSFIPSIGRLGTEFALAGGKKPGKYLSKVLNSLADAFNPIGSGTLLQTVSPTATDPVAALAENKDWTGKDIARKDFNSLRPTPGYTRAKDTASWVAKTTAYYLNAATGGTKYTPGLLSPTPDQIDYLLGQFTGGVGRELLKAQQTGSALMTGEDLPPHKIPLVGRFYGNAENQSAVATTFYDNLKELNLLDEEIEGRIKDHANPREVLREHPEGRLADVAGSAQRQVAELRKRKQQLIDRGADKMRVREIELQQRRVMERFNAKVEELRKRAP